MRSQRRWLAAAVAPVLTATLLTVTAQPVAAVEDVYVPSTTLDPQTYGYVDSASGVVAEPVGDLPIGPTTRTYFTFDVAALRDARVLEATLNAEETQANDCARRSVEVWVVPSTAYAPPAGPDHFRVATAGAPTSGCLVTDAEFDVTRALTWAVNNDRDTVTLALRVAPNREADQRFGRRYANDPTLAIRYNTPPPRPTDPRTEYAPCAGNPPGLVRSYPSFALNALLGADADGEQDERVGQFEVWPVTDETAKRTFERPSDPSGNVMLWVDDPALDLSDQTYAWRVRANDGTHTSPWTKTCHYTLNLVHPQPPTVTSDDFPAGTTPSGDVGVPGFITFTAHDPDVVSFVWLDPTFGQRTVQADQRGGSATVKFTPTYSGEQSVVVQAIDDALNFSDQVTYAFNIRETRPAVWSNLYTDSFPAGGVGVPGVFFFAANQPGATRFLYRLNDEPQASVPVPSGGTTSVLLTPTVGGSNTLRVRTRDAAGNLGAWFTYTFLVETRPRVILPNAQMIVGEPATIRFEPRMPNVVSYEWWWGDGEPQVVTAAADGTGSVTFVPSADVVSSQQLRVRSRSADGTYSAAYDSFASVDLRRPTVTGDTTGNPGRPVHIDVQSDLDGVATFEWQVDSGEWQSVPADAAGNGEIIWTPPEENAFNIYVRARSADGVVTGSTLFGVFVSTAPSVSSAEYPRYGYPDYVSGGGVGIEGTFVIEPGMDDVVEYYYRISHTWEGIQAEGTIPAGPDGTASFTFTPALADIHFLEIRSRTADGTESAWLGEQFSVNWQ